MAIFPILQVFVNYIIYLILKIMLLEFYKSSKSSGRRSAELDYEGLKKVLEDPRLKKQCEAYRNGDVEAKKGLPCIAYMGRSKTGQRKADLMEPTGISKSRRNSW